MFQCAKVCRNLLSGRCMMHGCFLIHLSRHSVFQSQSQHTSGHSDAKIDPLNTSMEVTILFSPTRRFFVIVITVLITTLLCSPFSYENIISVCIHAVSLRVVSADLRDCIHNHLRFAAMRMATGILCWHPSCRGR